MPGESIFPISNPWQKRSVHFINYLNISCIRVATYYGYCRHYQLYASMGLHEARDKAPFSGRADGSMKIAGMTEYLWVTGNTKQWFKVSEVATGLNVSVETVRKWCESGKFPNAIKDDNPRIGWRIPRSSLIAFLEARQAGKQS
jgi:hypothetical protein